MSKKYLFIAIILLLVVGGIFLILNTQIALQQPTQFTTELLTPSPTPTTKTARFAIYTNGTKRVFSETKYHNQSKDVFIEAGDPSLVYVTQSDVTWGDFFNTLPSPLKVQNECLTIETGQTFCEDMTNSLQFYLNGEMAPDALTTEIKDGDTLLVTYGNPSPQELQNQLQSLQQ